MIKKWIYCDDADDSEASDKELIKKIIDRVYSCVSIPWQESMMPKEKAMECIFAEHVKQKFDLAKILSTTDDITGERFLRDVGHIMESVRKSDETGARMHE